MTGRLAELARRFQDIIDHITDKPFTWGQGDGTLSDQTDLQTALDEKATSQEVADKFSLSISNAVEIPDGFSYTPPFNIYRTTNGYTTDLDIHDYEPETDVTFYLSPDGNDSNDGLSEENPKQSIRVLISDLNSSGTYNSVTFILSDGKWDQSNTWTTDSANVEFNLVIKCENGRALLTIEHPTVIPWLKTSGQDNVWEFDIGSGSPLYFAYDHQNNDEFDRPIRPIRVSSISECDSTPSSYFVSGTVVYVHTFDSREPDTDVRMQRNSPSGSLSGAQFNSGGILFCENIDFWGGVKPLRAESSAKTEIFLKNCTLGYGHQSNNQEFNLTHPESIVIIENSESFYGYLDGFSVRNADYIEVDCFSHNNGYSGGGGDNASTTHSGTKSIRINGVYIDSEDRNVHDVGNGTESWLLNCISGTVRNIGDATESFNFGFGSTGQDNNTKAWLEDCESLGGATADMNVNGSNASVKLRNFIKKGVKRISGAVETY